MEITLGVHTHTHTHTYITQKFENDFQLGPISSSLKWTFEKKTSFFVELMFYFLNMYVKKLFSWAFVHMDFFYSLITT